jgi:hypothetical protein
MARLSFHRTARALGALSLLVGLAACVAPQPRYYGGGYGRGYAFHQPAYRGGYNPGWHGGPPRRWH